MTSVAGRGENQPLFSQVEGSGQQVQHQSAVLALAAAAAAAAAGAAPQHPAHPGQQWGASPPAPAAGQPHSPAAAPSGGTLPSGDGSDGGGGGDQEVTDDLEGQQPGQRNSGSHSTMEPSDWQMNDEQQRTTYSSQQAGGGSDPAGLLQRGRRNARQQEQNKQAQQRYRAKRKAQFEELQKKVHTLSSDAIEIQRQRKENEKLMGDMAKLKALLQAATTTIPTVAAAAAASGAAANAGLLQIPGPASPAAPPGHQLQLLQQQNGINHPSSLLAGGAGNAPPGNGAFKPTSAAVAGGLTNTTSAAPADPLPAAGAAPAIVAPAAGPSGELPMLPSKQIHAVLNLYYQDLQAFASLVQLERLPVDGAGLGTEAARQLTQLVHTGIELVKMVLQSSGPDAASLLTANLPSLGPDGVSPSDSLTQWQMVAARVALTPSQRLLLADWRARFLKKIDDCYGRRLLHKAQLAQMPATGAGGQVQWVEALLLQAAESVGFSACALACAQLDGVVCALQENVREERSTACAMMAELLDRILTKVQAARFLLAGHPFCWNGLSFAHAAASMQQQQQQQGASRQ